MVYGCWTRLGYGHTEFEEVYLSLKVAYVSLVETFDILFLADLLWYAEAHDLLLDSVVTMLGPTGKAWIGCGEYSTLETCESFMRKGEKRGLKSRRIELSDEWQGQQKSSLKNLKERKKRVWLWEMSWDGQERS